jgi:CDGSH-type Zn-finger protein/truncated hemoglobin YjbI
MTDLEAVLQRLREMANDLAAALPPDGDDHIQRIRRRLDGSVLRPLRQLTREPQDSATPVRGAAEASSDVAERLWALTRTATALRMHHPDVAELAEAVAALQHLALSDAGEDSAARRAELAALQATLEPRIQVAANGPYLVTNASGLSDWLGRTLPLPPLTALCRCGQSQMKPFCDGTHAAIPFTDAKDPNRVPDRLDTYVGQQVTVLDNRGTCQHSGLCTERLAGVFHQGGEPFVTASGGRMDEIIRAVRDCPSGALSYAIDGRQARDQVDYHGTREQAVQVTKDGPYRITGGLPLVNHAGADIARNQGASREHYALCRCGHSQNKPFCSGMHWYVEFRDPPPDSDQQTIFEWAGGLPALTRMTRLFYEKHVPQDPLLAPLFATMSADHPERVAKWLGEVFGGPRSYSTEYGGYPRMLSQHLGKRLSEQQRARWVTLLLQSAREAGLPNDAEFRSAFGAYLEWGSRLAVENSQTEATPPEHMPMPHWDWNTAAGPPGSRVSALTTSGADADEPAVVPAPGEPIRFDPHIKSLFRRHDRQSMLFALDLWSHDDVSAHAEDILDRLRNATMPCDGPWPPDRVEVFHRWVEDGKSP